MEDAYQIDKSYRCIGFWYWPRTTADPGKYADVIAVIGSPAMILLRVWFVSDLNWEFSNPSRDTDDHAWIITQY